MLDPAIQSFLHERKEARIKNKIKASMSDDEKLDIERAAEEEFSLATWLPNAANRAKQLSLVSHPGKFTHPSAKTSSIIASSSRKADGFLRTGNAESGLDVVGNAATLDVYKFLMLIMQDEETVLRHLEQETSEVQNQFAFPTTTFDEIRSGLLAIKKGDTSTQKTHERIKQVYFPVDNDYHLLSILTPSALMFKFKERINVIRFSEQTKQARESKRTGEFDKEGFSELYDLTVIGFGGNQPQNISVLNSQNYGEAYLLQSLPPTLQQRSIHPPRRSFFTNTLNPWTYKESFQFFHKLLYIDYKNKNIREGRDKIIQYIIAQVIERLWMVRKLEQGWSENERYAQLPAYQKLWLDDCHAQDREDDDEWLVKVENELARWFLISYQRVIGKQAIGLGDEELPHIKKIIQNNKEGLR